ncbi:hypothetical protein P154DRAFT_570913 [Amniculicola lignicola CBS 123094]|uniref:Uncharacterized protein n=1 Tax=Amniculicola lignicola CBS 123094 TaxID=1392246 RepID=A0A6A5WZL1_9PLEO|nr:hypothetical protein P154DRAFT_570913 [Amniculicola lignicola CBS 123094]
MEPFETFPDRKLKFLAQQKRVLVQSVTSPVPPRLARIVERSGIPEKIVRDVFVQVDREIRRHAQEVYSRQMMDEVVAKIDEYYWESAKGVIDAHMDTTVDFDEDEGAVYVTDDLSLDENIAKLPPTWNTSADLPSPSEEEEEEEERDPVDEDDYLTAISRLQSLSAQRLTLQQKLTTCRTLLDLLEPFRKPRKNIQPNLVWNDTPLAPELKKTRTLAIRVAGRVGEKYGEGEAQVPSSVEEEGDEDVEMGDEGRGRVEKVLGGW